MMETKFTPGPWAKDSNYCVGPRSVEDDQSYGMVIPVADVYGEHRDADARLIAAAPELLAALNRLVKVALVRGADTGTGSAYAESVAAIAKATGA